MSDIIDTANDRADEFLADSLAAAARNAASGPVATGLCLNPGCALSLPADRRWCDAECRDQWEHAQRQRRGVGW